MTIQMRVWFLINSIKNDQLSFLSVHTLNKITRVSCLKSIKLCIRLLVLDIIILFKTKQSSNVVKT